MVDLTAPTPSLAASLARRELRGSVMSLKIWIDGQLVDKSEARISVYDHGLLYGDGVFEGIRVYSSKIFELEAHLDRLWNSAKAIRLQIPISRDEMTRAMYETVKAN